MSRCRHPKKCRKEGPREPMVWGTGPTEVCTRCGATRNMLHDVPGRWRAKLTYENTLIEDCDGDSLD